MSNKPRPLGYRAREMVAEIDMHLAHAWRELREQADGEHMTLLELRLIAHKVRTDISEARRLIAEVQGLRE